MKSSSKYFLIKSAIIVGVLPYILLLISGLLMQASLAIGSCVPYEDLARGDFLCEFLAVYRLFYMALMPLVGIPLTIILVVGVIAGIVLYATESRKEVLDLDNRKNLRVLRYLLVLGLIVIAISIYGAWRQNQAVKEFSKALNDPSIPGNCKMYADLTGPEDVLNETDLKRVEYFKEKGCGDKVTVKPLNCIVYAKDPLNLTPEELKKVKWFKEQRCPGTLESEEQEVYIHPECTIYESGGNPEHTQNRVNFLKESGCTDVTVKNERDYVKNVK